MSLQLATPTGAVTLFPGGTVMIRCADYVASTRGTVGVVTDAQSVCGDVVHETQLVPYATSAGFGSPWLADYEYVNTEDAEPTLSIPFADLPLIPEIEYVAFIGVKIVGAGDINHRVGEQFMTLSDQNTRIRAYNDTIDDSFYPSIQPGLPRPETNPEYRLRWFQYMNFVDAFPDPYHEIDGGSLGSPPTDLIVVAAAGEDSTYEFYLDAIYLIPAQGTGSPGSNYIQHSGDATAWDPLVSTVTFDPLPDRTTDDDTATNALNILAAAAGYSVIWSEPNGYGSGWSAPGGDYQRADSQPSFYDISNQGLWDGPTPTWPDDPSSWIAITASLIVVPQHTIETETFSTDHPADTTPWSFLSESGTYYWDMLTNGGTFGQSVVGGVLDFDNVECLTVDTRSIAKFGYTGFLLPITGSPSHTSVRQTVDDLSAGTIQATTAILSEPDNGQMYSWVGWERLTPNDADVTINGVALYLDGGDLKATLRGHQTYDPQFGTTRRNRANFGTSPVTIQAGYSLGDEVNVLVERRYYVWRAKVWMVGDSMPTGWTLEGFEPSFYPDTANNPTVLNVSQYPYTDADQDVWGAEVRVYMGDFPCLGAVTDPQTGSVTAFGHVTFSSFSVAYDPVGDRDTVHFNLRKHDGTVDYGTVQYDTDRVIVASLAQHTFDDDAHGVTMSIWSESGAAELQSASWTDFFIRAPLPGPIFGDIKHP